MRTTTFLLAAILMGVTTTPARAEPSGANEEHVDAALPELFTRMLGAAALVRGGDDIVAWDAGSTALWHLSGGRLRLVDARTGKEILTLEEAGVRRALSTLFGEAAGRGALPLETMSIAADGMLAFRLNGIEGRINPSDYTGTAGNASDIKPAGTFPRYLFMYPGFPSPDALSPDGTRAATVQADGNIAVRRLEESAFAPITANAGDRFGWDLDTRRVSVGSAMAVQTTPWSPDSRLLFAMRIDRRRLPQVPEFQVLVDPIPEIVQRDVFPAGGPYYSYHPAIIDAGTGAQRNVQIDLDTDYALFLNWSEDSRTAYMARIDRRFSRIDIIAVDAATGAARVVLTEQDARGGLYSPHAVFYAANVGFTPLPDGKGFLWLSERDGWNHIYHYSHEGRMIRQLTRGNWRVENISAVDVDAGKVFFTARPDKANIYDVHVMSVPVGGGAVRQLTQARGMHDRPLFSRDRRAFIDRFESFDTPPTTELRTADGKRIAVIATADTSALEATGWQPPLEFVVDGPDGTPVHGVLYRPFDFDPQRRYPVIDYIYGGPQTTWSHPGFMPVGEAVGANMPLALAQLGYVVVKIDTAGTPGRSRDFQIAVTQKWGPGIAGDHAAAIRSLGERFDWIDTDKVGIFGHSWGGLNVLHALASHGDVFKAGIASGPGFGIPSIPDGFLEVYLGSPAQNPQAWERADIMRTITNVRRPLMMVSGTQDYVIYLSMLRASNALIKAGIQHEVALAPGQGHGIYGAHADYLAEKQARFFLENLPPPGGP